MLFYTAVYEVIMHKSVHKSSVPDSSTLLFIAKSYLNVFFSFQVCMYACVYQELLKIHNKFLVCSSTLGK